MQWWCGTFSNLIFCVFFVIKLTVSFQETTQCKLVNISASLTSNSMDVQWDVQGGPCSIKKYKIKARHLGYKACPGRSLKNPVSPKTASTTATKASFEKLEAYSIYNVTIEGFDSDGQIIIRDQLQVETLSDQPDLKPTEGTAKPQRQAIHFGWANQPIIYDETTCKLQRGEKGGFYIELYGRLNPLSRNDVSEGLLRNKTSDINGFYAKKLRPYSRYSLIVYVRNKDGSYNKDLFLNITAKTQPYIPEAPIETKATATSSETVHLKWQPHYPPTGSISKYKVRYGPKSEPMIWKAELEMLNSSNLCSKQSKEFNFACANVHGLKANTTYLFQVQTFNFKFNSDESQSGSWSSEFEARTDPDPNEITTRSPKNPEVTSKPNLKNRESNVSNNSTPHLVGIIVSLVVIVILVIVVALLVYKIKMYKLKQKYETRQRRPRHGSIESNPGQFESLNVTALGSYYPSMSTIAYNVPSVAYQVRDIQNRKLPDPPSPTLLSEVEQELYENTNLTYLTPTASTTSPDLIANVNMPRSSTPKILMSPTRPQTECTDVDGYLCPTFCERPLQTLMPTMEQRTNFENHATVIPTESYVSAVQLEAEAEQQQSQRTTSPNPNELHPLISLTETTETF